jgi:methyl coenzyme M reductase subunit C-like uncharacterized protein (methanogenesis marker protein 7)
VDDRRGFMDRVVEATEGAVSRMQQEMSSSPVVSATLERAQAVRQRAQQAAVSNLPLATGDDIARLQAQLDRIEAAVNDLLLRTTAPASGPTVAEAQSPPPPLSGA